MQPACRSKSVARQRTGPQNPEAGMLAGGHLAALRLCPLDTHFLSFIPHKAEVCGPLPGRPPDSQFQPVFPLPNRLPTPLSSWGLVRTLGRSGHWRKPRGSPISGPFRASVHLQTSGRIYRFHPTGDQLFGT